MEYTVEKITDFSVIGFEKKIAEATAFKDCPEFWDEFGKKYFYRLIGGAEPKTPVEKAICDFCIGQFGVCVCAGNGHFNYMIAGKYTGGEVPEGLKVFTFPDMFWLKFVTHGKMPDSLQKLNREIFENWLPGQSKYALKTDANVEWYSQGDMSSADYECGIWIPVKEVSNTNDDESFF